MKRELIEDFLNLPGIVGIALMDGQSRSYAYGLPEICSDEQQHLLTQGIQQIVETTPMGLESFSFHAAQHQVWLYKINQGMSLLVLAEPILSEDYAKAIAQITRFIRADFDAVADGLMALALPVRALEKGQPLSSEAASPSSLIPPTVTVNHEHPLETVAATIDEILAAMNLLSDFTTQYLGKFIVANHWRTNRPPENWLEQFQVAPDGAISLGRENQLCQTDTLSEQELAWIRHWVAGFSQRCAKIIRDYQDLVHRQALNERQWKLLFEAP